MPGTIVDVKVKVGDKVNAGDAVLVIEAMKMENEIQAPTSGIVIAVHVKKGDTVTPDETLLEIQLTYAQMSQADSIRSVGLFPDPGLNHQN